MKGFLERAALLLNVVVVLLLAFLAFRRGGPGYAALREWRAERHMASVLRERWPTLTAGPTRLDSVGGEVRLIEFADYECPFCKQAQVAVEKLLDARPDIGVVYVQFPLSSHRAARGAALAALCAGEQGRFRQLHRRLFTTEAWKTDTNWVREARAVAIPDQPRFAACMRDLATIRLLEADIALGLSLGIDRTPVFLSRRERFLGLPQDSTLLRLADQH